MEKTTKNYVVITLHHKGETIKKFTMFGLSVERKVGYYLKNGWEMVDITRCNREEYLNARIDDVMAKYNYAQNELEMAHIKYKANAISPDTYRKTREINLSVTEGYLFSLRRWIEMLWNEGYDCYNEEAHTLYNMVF